MANSSIPQVVKKVLPAVVSITVSKLLPVFEVASGATPSGQAQLPVVLKGKKKMDVGGGSGFIIESSGLVLTNRHVVSDPQADYMVVTNEEEKYPAQVLVRDQIHDVAVLKIDKKNLPTIKLGDSAKLELGQTAIAIGNVLGTFRDTVSVGVVSGLQRSIVASGAATGPEILQELIQTDAAINPGNSGGPLLNLYGEVIAINTAVASGAENIGFALPINKAKRDLENVQKFGKIIYPFLGVRYVMVTKELAEKQKLGKDYGALVAGAEGQAAVLPGSPAEKAGIKEGDIILELNGEILNLEHTLASVIQKHQVDEDVSLKVFRDGKELEVKTKLEERK